eukprot:3520617-Amphidinium_carterae.1
MAAVFLDKLQVVHHTPCCASWGGPWKHVYPFLVRMRSTGTNSVGFGGGVQWQVARVEWLLRCRKVVQVLGAAKQKAEASGDK